MPWQVHVIIFEQSIGDHLTGSFVIIANYGWNFMALEQISDGIVVNSWSGSTFGCLCCRKFRHFFVLQCFQQKKCWKYKRKTRVRRKYQVVWCLANKQCKKVGRRRVRPRLTQIQNCTIFGSSCSQLDCRATLWVHLGLSLIKILDSPLKGVTAALRSSSAWAWYSQGWQPMWRVAFLVGMGGF